MSHAPREHAPATASARIGHPRVRLRSTDSTNDRARELALAGAPHGALVTASQQTAGRGRQGRRWSAPAGSALLMSLLLRQQSTAQPLELLPLIAAVAVCDAIGERAQIKWPNDIVIVREEGSTGNATGASDPEIAKLGGILSEGRPQEDWAVLGIGLNVAVPLERLTAELEQDASPAAVTSPAPLPAATLGAGPEEIEPTLARLLDALERRLQEPTAQTLADWRLRDALRGREIAWGAHGSQGTTHRGRAEGIDEAGRLLVALADGQRVTLGAGEVHLEGLD